MDLSAFNLRGKVALIATVPRHRFSIAEGMAKCGAVICFNCSSGPAWRRAWLPRSCRHQRPHGYVADVSDEDAVNAMVAKIKAEVGRWTILVNNAGLQ